MGFPLQPRGAGEILTASESLTDRGRQTQHLTRIFHIARARNIVIAQDGDAWSVISLSGYYLREPNLDVLQSGLTTLEAAQACRECHINNARDDALNSLPYHRGSEVPLEWFNTRGIVEAVQRQLLPTADVR